MFKRSVSCVRYFNKEKTFWRIFLANIMNFGDFVVRKCPQSAQYIPNFITFEDEQNLLKQIEKTPKPKWTQLRNRRLINYGGLPHPNGMIAEKIPNWLQTYIDKINNLNIFEHQKANHVLINEYKPGQGIMAHTDGPLFYPIISTISIGSHTILEFTENNQRLKQTQVQEQLPHNTICNNQEEKVHQDDEANCKLSLNKCQSSFKLLLEPRSLLVLKGTLYTDYMHSISEIKSDILCDHIYNYENCGNVYKIGDRLTRESRISLTIRNVPKVTKVKLKFS